MKILKEIVIAVELLLLWIKLLHLLEWHLHLLGIVWTWLMWSKYWEFRHSSHWTADDLPFLTSWSDRAHFFLELKKFILSKILQFLEHFCWRKQYELILETYLDFYKKLYFFSSMRLKKDEQIFKFFLSNYF